MDDDITHDPDADSYVVDVTLDRPDAPADAIVTTVASVRDRDPLDLPPLADVVDTDALGDLFRPGANPEADVQVAFDYADFRVTVYGHGEVRLVDLSESQQ